MFQLLEDHSYRWFSLALQFKRLGWDFTKIKFLLEHWGNLILIQMRHLELNVLLWIIVIIEAMAMSFHPGKRVFWELVCEWASFHLSFIRQISLYFSYFGRGRKFTRRGLKNQWGVGKVYLTFKNYFLFKNKIGLIFILWNSFSFTIAL